jgi:hypothetical protein
MTFIDWSNTEELLGLLIEYVRDAKSECRRDIERRQFLSKLLLQLTSLSDNLTTISLKEAANGLRKIYNSIHTEFQEDPVATHILDCIHEFER